MPSLNNHGPYHLKSPAVTNSISRTPDYTTQMDASNMTTHVAATEQPLTLSNQSRTQCVCECACVSVCVCARARVSVCLSISRTLDYGANECKRLDDPHRHYYTATNPTTITNTISRTPASATQADASETEEPHRRY